jgi:DNA-binding winged helix-turn-helix (wHTH) protein
MPRVFGDFILDEERRQLLRAGMPLALEPKAYELLSLLVARQPRALSKNQIHQVLWAGAFGSESALAGLIADLRSVLGDDARRPRFIRTVHGFGYAFCGEARGDERRETTPVEPILRTVVLGGSGQPRVFDRPFTALTEPDTSFPSTVVRPGHRVTNVRLVRLAIAATVIGLGGVIGWWLVARPGVTGVEPPRPTVTRLRFDTGLQTQPTWSPGERFIAYASDRNGNLDIWVQPISGGQAVPVTNDPADDSAPAWSPDGQQIAFRSERQGGRIYVVGALGGGERRLAGFGSSM